MFREFYTVAAVPNYKENLSLTINRDTVSPSENRRKDTVSPSGGIPFHPGKPLVIRGVLHSLFAERLGGLRG